MAPLPGPATGLFAVATLLASCGLWVCQEDPRLVSLPSQVEDIAHHEVFEDPRLVSLPSQVEDIAQQEVFEVFEQRAEVEPAVQVPEAVVQVPEPVVQVPEPVVSLQEPEVGDINTGHASAPVPVITMTNMVSSFWLFILVDICLGIAVLLFGRSRTTRQVDDAIAIGASAAGSAESSLPTLPNGSPSFDNQPLLNAAARSNEVPLLPDTVCKAESPVAQKSPAAQSPERAAEVAAATPERRSGSRGAGSRIIAPKGVQHWLASRARSPNIQGVVEQRAQPNSGDSPGTRRCPEHSPAAKKLVNSAKAVLASPIVTSTPEQASPGNGLKQPRGVQEWHQKHQTPLVKATSLEDAFAASALPTFGAPTPSRGTVRSTTPRKNASSRNTTPRRTREAAA